MRAELIIASNETGFVRVVRAGMMCEGRIEAGDIHKRLFAQPFFLIALILLSTMVTKGLCVRIETQVSEK